MGLRIYREHNESLQLIGSLSENGAFTYATRYLQSDNAQAISFSLPLQPEPYDAAHALPYFKGLLPEGKSLAHLAARLGRSEEDYIGLLNECGLDCVGDIIICPEAHIESRHYRKTSIEELQRAFSSNMASAVAGTLSSSRLSLAGTQEKIGLYVADNAADLADDSAWYLPVGGAPSNCILKIAGDDLPQDLMVAEQLGMACARSCGLNASESELVPIGRISIIVKRFDRTERGSILIDGLAAPT